MIKKIVIHSGRVSSFLKEKDIIHTVWGGSHDTGHHPAHCSSVTSMPGPPFLKFLGTLYIIFFIIHNRKKKLNQNVEFDFSIGHAVVLLVLLNNRQKM